MGFITPSERILRKTYLEQSLINLDYYIIFHQTKSRKQENILALLIGQLNSPAAPYVFAIQAFDKVNGGSVIKFVNDSLADNFVIPAIRQHLNLLHTNGAAYCISVGEKLKDLLSETKHVTCIR